MTRLGALDETTITFVFTESREYEEISRVKSKEINFSCGEDNVDLFIFYKHFIFSVLDE